MRLDLARCIVSISFLFFVPSSSAFCQQTSTEEAARFAEVLRSARPLAANLADRESGILTDHAESKIALLEEELAELDVEIVELAAVIDYVDRTHSAGRSKKQLLTFLAKRGFIDDGFLPFATEGEAPSDTARMLNPSKYSRPQPPILEESQIGSLFDASLSEMGSTLAKKTLARCELVREIKLRQEELIKIEGQLAGLLKEFTRLCGNLLESLD